MEACVEWLVACGAVIKAPASGAPPARICSSPASSGFPASVTLTSFLQDRKDVGIVAATLLPQTAGYEHGPDTPE